MPGLGSAGLSTFALAALAAGTGDIGFVYAEQAITEWTPRDKVVVFGEQLLVEWEPTNQLWITGSRALVEWYPRKRLRVLAESSLVEWVAGSTMFVDPPRIIVRIPNTLFGSNTPVSRSLADFALAQLENGGDGDGFPISDVEYDEPAGGLVKYPGPDEDPEWGP